MLNLLTHNDTRNAAHIDTQAHNDKYTHKHTQWRIQPNTNNDKQNDTHYDRHTQWHSYTHKTHTMTHTLRYTQWLMHTMTITMTHTHTMIQRMTHTHTYNSYIFWKISEDSKSSKWCSKPYLFYRSINDTIGNNDKLRKHTWKHKNSKNK